MATTIPYPFELVTERLIIRAPAITDALYLREAITESIEALRPWMVWADHVPTLLEAEDNCSRAAEDFKEGKDFRLHLFLRDSGVFIGGSGLHNVVWSIPKFEIGYWVRQSHSGHGYGSEAVTEITRFAFAELGAKRVEIRTSTRNIKSQRIPESLGFILEGILRNDARHIDGSLRDTKVYSKIEKEEKSNLTPDQTAAFGVRRSA
jgi:RimJ/RimL family protein N-acetyltransferase